MPLEFFPSQEELEKVAALEERIRILKQGAEKYKKIILETYLPYDPEKRSAPTDLKIAFNWDAIAVVLQKIRKLPESNAEEKTLKKDSLLKMAEIYDILRAAKMPKLDAVRTGIIKEAEQLNA